MSYTINLTDGAVFAVIPDGTINTASSMVLVGKNYAGYGEFLDENFIHLLENSSNSTAPAAPLEGQLWWDSTNLLMKAYNGSAWKTISAATAQSSAPTGNVVGDFWFDTTNQQLNIWTGAVWLIVGPAYSSSQGVSGAIALTINDVSSNPHNVTAIYANNSIVAIFNPDTSFTPVAPYSTNFPTVFKGYTVWAVGNNGGNIINVGNVYVTSGGNATMNITSTGANVTGYTTVSGNITGGNIITAGVMSSTGAAVHGGAISGASVSASGAVVAGTSGSFGTTVSAAGTVTGGNLATGGTISAASSITGLSLTVSGAASLSSITKTGANASGDIGSVSNYFNRVYATATTALYADVAERFAADEELVAGTVVELGGEKEITKSRQELSENVFGVISTRAAYLMNGGAGTDSTHPPVAMTGRVPVQVVGAVRKGDRLVSAGNGIARAARPGEANSFNVIGRSLVDKTSTEQSTIEAIVTIKN